MLWIFERANQTLQVETRIDNRRREYVLIVRSHGTEQVDHFPDGVSFQMRVVALERQLEKEQWHTHSSVAMRDAWKLEPGQAHQ
jgi:hypothetical protein